MADNHDPEPAARVRSAIIRHLLRFPSAGDTPEGIVACWLPSFGYEDASNVIGIVIGAMVAAGELTPRNLPDGRVLYVRGPALPDRE